MGRRWRSRRDRKGVQVSAVLLDPRELFPDADHDAPASKPPEGYLEACAMDRGALFRLTVAEGHPRPRREVYRVTGAPGSTIGTPCMWAVVDGTAGRILLDVAPLAEQGGRLVFGIWQVNGCNERLSLRAAGHLTAANPPG